MWYNVIKVGLRLYSCEGKKLLLNLIFKKKNTNDLAMAGWNFLLTPLTQSVWHLVLVLLQKKKRSWRDRKLCRRCSDKNKNVKRMKKEESERSLGFKSSWGNSPGILHVVLEQSLVRGTFSLLLQTFLSVSGSHPLVHAVTQRTTEEDKDSVWLLFLVTVMWRTSQCLILDVYFWLKSHLIGIKLRFF